MKNVTPKTLAWYEQSFRAFDGALADEASIKRRVVELRSRGISPVSVNTRLRCINAYVKWTGASFKIPRLQKGKKLRSTLTQDHIQRITPYKPPKSMWRTHVAVLLLLECGLRISELLNLTYQQVDLDNLVLRIKGKGRKERLVPISTEMRRRLYQYIKKRLGPPTYLFATRTGNRVTVRNFQRDMWQLGKHLHITDIRFSPHPCDIRSQSAI